MADSKSVQAGVVPSEAVPEKWQKRLAKYRGEIQASKAFMVDECYWEKWRDFNLMYADQLRTSDDPDIDMVDVPIAFSNINILRSATTVSNPEFTVSPRNRTSYLPAAFCEAALNHEWDHGDFQDEIRDAVDDFLISGNCWLKTSYELSTHGDRDEIPALSAEQQPSYSSFDTPGFSVAFDELVERSRKAHSQITLGGSELPPNSELARQLREHGTLILQDRAILEKVSPFDMLVDSSATSLKNAQWVAQRVPVRMDVAEDNKNWPARVRAQLSAGRKSIAEEDDTHAGGAVLNDSPNFNITEGGTKQEWVIIWEFYDLHTGEWCVFADDLADDFLVRPEVAPHKFGHPFVFKKNYSVPNKFYGIGEIEKIKSLQIEMNKARSQLINDRKGNKRKYMVQAKYLADSRNSNLREVLVSDEDNLIASVELDNKDTLESIIARVPSAVIDPDLYNITAIVKGDINETTGITEYQRGGTSSGSATATEASIVNDGAQARMREKQGKIEMLMRDCARKLVMLKQQYQTAEKTLRIVIGGNSSSSKRFLDKLEALGLDPVEEYGGDYSDVSPTELYVKYGRENIVGEFDLEIEVGSSAAFNVTERRRAAQELMGVVGPLLESGLFDVQAVMKYVIKNGFNIPNAEQFLAKPQEAEQGPQGQPYSPDGQGQGQPSVPGGVLPPGGGIPQSQVGGQYPGQAVEAPVPV